jgi:hypothetical protein
MSILLRFLARILLKHLLLQSLARTILLSRHRALPKAGCTMLLTTFNVIANSGIVGKSKKPPAKRATDKSAAGLAENVKGLSVQESVKVRSKNLDVLAEYEKSQRKKAANFVVIGLLSFVLGNWRFAMGLTAIRACGCWKEHTYGPIVIRPEDD